MATTLTTTEPDTAVAAATSAAPTTVMAVVPRMRRFVGPPKSVNTTMANDEKLANNATLELSRTCSASANTTVIATVIRRARRRTRWSASWRTPTNGPWLMGAWGGRAARPQLAASPATAARFQRR